MTTNLGKNVLLDSSVVIHCLRGGSNLLAKLFQFSNFFLPNIALAELYFGAYRSIELENNLFQIEKFLDQVALVFPDAEITKTYGYIAANLANIGKSIPQNDIWIAAVARHLALPLATLDQHFKYVDGLEIISC